LVAEFLVFSRIFSQFLMFSRILAEFCGFRINSAKPDISRKNVSASRIL